MNAADIARAVRRGAGLFRDLSREVIAVSGTDRVRWLNGMISNDVTQLASDAPNSGCYAVLLTAQGRIVSDLQVLARTEKFWIDADAGASVAIVEQLTKYIIADDVELVRSGADIERFALEGPAARQVLERVVSGAPDLLPDACAVLELAGVAVTVAAFGWSGETAIQFFTAEGSGDVVAEALRDAGSDLGLVDADAEALEILRIEAGVPRVNFDLDETVLPAEAGLERAIATTKGCYTGQEVVERLRSRGQVSHLLVGLETSGGRPLEVEAVVEADGKRAGEVTSACVSPVAGSIALAFVRRAFAEPGTTVQVCGRSAQVVRLPFVRSQASG